ncbi:paralemmin-3 isoform 2-T7 [Pholidichthys leucotaenia]
MMETEKYKQRLEAIAEKRRLQEAEDKARREMEEEKLRLQQLKRKSLRDQWLMEGASLSPTFLETQSTQPPLWGAQDMDESKAENQRSEGEKLEKWTEDGQTESSKVSEAGVEMVQDVVQNGNTNAASSENTKDEAYENQSKLVYQSAVKLTNGSADLNADPNHQSASEQNCQLTTNGPVVTTNADVGINMTPGLVVPARDSNEEEEGTLVMRAECVFITDEGDEELLSHDGHQEPMQSSEATLPNLEAEEVVFNVVEEVATAPECFTDLEKSLTAEIITEEHPATGDEAIDNTKNTENGDNEAEVDDQDKTLENISSVQVHSPLDALEGTVVALVPVYSEVQPSVISPKVKAEDEDSSAPLEVESASKPEVASEAQEPAGQPVQFQEISLTGSPQTQRSKGVVAEQEPLLLQDKALNTTAEPAGANSPASSQTQSPTRVSQGEQTETPKQKRCQCCSVM